MINQGNALKCLEGSTWGVTLHKAWTVYGMVVRSMLTFATSIWHNSSDCREEEDEDGCYPLIPHRKRKTELYAPWGCRAGMKQLPRRKEKEAKSNSERRWGPVKAMQTFRTGWATDGSMNSRMASDNIRHSRLEKICGSKGKSHSR